MDTLPASPDILDSEGNTVHQGCELSRDWEGAGVWYLELQGDLSDPEEEPGSLW